jgi:putative hydroxymethylpyrimidine transport system ATP-binding protein
VTLNPSIPAFPPPATDPPAFVLAASGFAYGNRAVLAPFHIEVRKGEILAVLGPSGGGKSTLLKLVAGLLPARLDQPVTGQVAWMAQQDLLLPWASARENVALGARLRGQPPNLEQADGLLRRLGLADHAMALPASLSGGMRQRVALARTLMEDRPLVLMDEPFSALDAITRLSMQDLASRELADRAVILVTHDATEACRLADRVYLLSGQPANLQLITTLSGPKPRDPLSADVLPALRTIQAALIQVAA